VFGAWQIPVLDIFTGPDWAKAVVAKKRDAINEINILFIIKQYHNRRITNRASDENTSNILDVPLICWGICSAKPEFQ